MSKNIQAEKIDPQIWRVAAVVFLGPLMAQLDSTVVNFSVSQIREDLHATLASAQWIISGYLLALALLLPLNGWLVDRLGTKRLYLICFTAFTGASLLCGMATTMNGLIAARVLQGIAGGILAPLTQMMLARAAGRHFSRVAGYTVVPVLLAPLLGPVLAGVILKYAGWPWLFYINLPIGIIAVIMAALLLPNDSAATQKRPFDFLGFMLISPGMVSMLYGFEHVSTMSGILFLVIGLTMMGGFVLDARKKKAAALIDLELFKNPTFKTAVTMQFLAFGAVTAAQMLIPLYLITGCALSVTQAGLTLAPMGLGMMCVFPMMGFLTDKFGCRRVSAGGATISLLSTLPFLWMIYTQFSNPLMAFCMLARGMGQGATNLPSIAAAYASVPKEQLGVATTASNIIQRLGPPVMTTALAFIVALAATHSPVVTPHDFLIPFLALIVLQIFVVMAARGLPLWIHPNNTENSARRT